MGRLWRKELATIAPFFYLMLFLIGMVLVEFVLTEIPDQLTYAETYEEYVLGRNGAAGFQLILVLAITSGLLVREFDDGTIEFLDSMPIGRGRIFVTKVVCALLVLLSYSALELGTSMAFHAIGRNSRDSSLHWGFVLTAAFLRLCQLYIMVSLGVLLSYLRRFGWLLAGLLIWMYVAFHERAPWMATFNFLELTDPRIEGELIVVPWNQLVPQLVVAAVLYLISYWLFVGAGDRMLRGYQRLNQSWGGSVFLVLGGIGLFVVGLALFIIAADTFADEPPDDRDKVVVVYPEWELAHIQTEHYRFVYRSNLEERAVGLANVADDVHEKVQAFFGDQTLAPIAVDATSSMERHAGRAKWNTVLMDLHAYEKSEHLAAVLGHETAHVMVDRLTNARLGRIFGSIRFFHEGVATYVEYLSFQPDGKIEQMYRTAAFMRRRDQVDFRTLVDDDEFSRRYDTNAVYPLGLVFVESLVDLYGPSSVATICRAVDREEASRKLSGREFWQDTLQSCGYNLDDLLNAFYLRLDRLVDENESWLANIPRIRGAFESSEDAVHVRPVWKPVDGWTPFCRFRQQSDSASSEYMFASLSKENEFVRSQHLFPSGKVWYQIGLRHEDGQWVFEPWQEATLR